MKTKDIVGLIGFISLFTIIVGVIILIIGAKLLVVAKIILIAIILLFCSYVYSKVLEEEDQREKQKTFRDKVNELKKL